MGNRDPKGKDRLKKTHPFFRCELLNSQRGYGGHLNFSDVFFFLVDQLGEKLTPPINPGCNRWSSSPPGWRLRTIFWGIGISQTSRPTRLWRLHPACGGSGSFPSDQQRSNFLCSNLHKHRGSLVQALLRIAGWHVRYFRIFQTQREGEEDHLLDDLP